MSVTGIGGASANYSVQHQAQRRARGADATGSQKPSGEYDQAKYLQELNSRVNATVIPGAWNGKDQFGANGATVMVHPDFLRKMHDDPALGEEYEAKINEWAEIDAASRKRLEEQGFTVDSVFMYIDENGDSAAHGQISRSGGDDKPEAVKAKAKDKKSMKEEMEKMLERLAEKRQEEKREAERIAGEEVVEKRTEASYKVDTLA